MPKPAPGKPKTAKRRAPAQNRLPNPPKRANSKQAKLIAMLQRNEGATIEQMAKAFGWQTHTVRGVLSGVLKKKLGLKVVSTDAEGGRVYRIA